MRIVLYRPPSNRKAAPFQGCSSSVAPYTAIQNTNNGKSLKRPSFILPCPEDVSSKKRELSQTKSSYQNYITHPNSGNLNVSPSCNNQTSFAQNSKDYLTNGLMSSDCKSAQEHSSPKRVVVHTSSSKLLKCLGEFLCRRCYKLTHLSPTDPVLWLRRVDRSLLLQGCQEQGFITTGSVVFLYMLCQEVISSELTSEQELQASFLTCAYVSYSYIGNELSYPVKPFLVERSKEVFWDRCLSVIGLMSLKMLRINADPQYFIQMFANLKAQGEQKPSQQGLDQ